VRTAISFGIVSVGLLAACITVAPSQAEGSRIEVPFREVRVGMPPSDFNFGVTGHGSAGKWTIVRDPTAEGGLALEQSSNDPTDDRFDFALRQDLSLKNVALTTRIKLIIGTMQSAGIVFRFVDANNYYVLRADALEGRVDIFSVRDGLMKRITGREAEFVRNHWHTLKVSANDDQLEVSLDGIWQFTASDRTFPSAGSVGLWTQEDNVTRFDRFEIKALPSTEGP
jgi:hypothetical protein